MKPIINNYTELTAFNRSQLTAQQVLNGQLYGPQGWESVTIAPEFRKQVINDLCTVYGGRKQADLKHALNRSTPPQHWAISRTFYEGDRWAYCAGQDYPAELNQLRKYLYNF